MPDDDDSPARLILIVTGSTLRAEELDRPLAYYLKQQVEGQLARAGPTAATRRRPRSWSWPTSAGSTTSRSSPCRRSPSAAPASTPWPTPGSRSSPSRFAVDEQYCIQMDPDLDEPRASIWGMDNATTQIAVVDLRRPLPRRSSSTAPRRCRRDRAGGRGRRDRGRPRTTTRSDRRGHRRALTAGRPSVAPLRPSGRDVPTGLRPAEGPNAAPGRAGRQAASDPATATSPGHPRPPHSPDSENGRIRSFDDVP